MNIVRYFRINDQYWGEHRLFSFVLSHSQKVIGLGLVE